MAATTAEESGGADVKPKNEPEGTINLKVRNADNLEVYFRCKLTTPFNKVMNAFCQKQGVAADKARFFFDGERIQGHQTPKDVGMEDGDAIDMFLMQNGGGSWKATF